MKYLAPLLLVASFVSTTQAGPIAQFEVHRIDNYLFSFSPDGALFASIVKVDGVPEMELHSSETGELITRSTHSASGTFSPAWIHDGNGLYTEGGGQEQILHWDGSSWNLLDVKGLSFGSFAGGHANLSTDGSRLSIDNYAHDISIVRLADQTWQPLAAEENRSHLATWSPDGRYLATGHDGSVIIWDAQDLHEVRRYEDISSSIYDNAVINSLAWSPSGQYLAIGTLYGSGYLVEPRSAEAELVDLLKGYDSISGLSWVSKSGLFWQEQEVLTYEAVDYHDDNEEEKPSEQFLIWYDPEDDENFYDHSFGPDLPGSVNFLLLALPESANAIIYSEAPDFEREEFVKYILIVDPDGGVTRKELPENSKGVAVSPNGRYIAIREMGEDGIVRASLWDFDTFMDEL